MKFKIVEDRGSEITFQVSLQKKKLYKGRATIVAKGIENLELSGEWTFDDDKAKRFTYLDKRWAYIRIPKCASSSVLQTLNTWFWGEKLVRPVDPGEVSNPAEIEFIFTIIRNPFDRLVSCYEGNISSGDGQYRDPTKDLLGLGYPPISWESFIEKVCNTKEADCNHHFRDQIGFYRDFLDAGIQIFKFENLENAWDVIAKNLAKLESIDTRAHNPYLLNHRNRRLSFQNISKRRKSRDQYYTEEMIQKVEERFSEDLKAGNYSYSGFLKGL